MAAILDTYSSSQPGGPTVPWMLSMEDYNAFRAVWAKFDPVGTKGITEAQLPLLMKELHDTGHVLGGPRLRLFPARVRMAFVKSMIAEYSAAKEFVLFGGSNTRRMKFVPVLLVRACARVPVVCPCACGGCRCRPARDPSNPGVASRCLLCPSRWPWPTCPGTRWTRTTK